MRGPSRTEFARTIAEFAVDLRRRIEAEVTGLDDSPDAVRRRRARALSEDGFEFFCRTYFPHYVKSESSRLHEHLYARLPEILKSPQGCRDVIAAPRGEAKSTICSQLFPLWCVARAVKHYAIVIMDSATQALMMVEAIKTELEANPRLALDFPDIAGAGAVWREGVCVTKNGVKIEGKGSGQKLRGLRHGPYRPDLVVLDDIENDDNVRSPEQRDRLETWLDKAVMNLGGPDGSLDVLYIGTVLHYDSVLARKMRAPLWRAIRFQAIRAWPDRRDLWDRWEEILRNDGEAAADAFYAAEAPLMEAGSEVSWPAVRPLLALMKKRVEIGAASFDAEYQNDPVSEADALFGNVLFWTDQRQWLYVGAVDPSLGRQNRGRDPSAILVGGIDRETGILDVVEASIRRRLPDLIIEEVIRLQGEYRCLKWVVEAVQFQAFFAGELVKRSAQRGIAVPVVAVTPLVDKALRIEALQPHVANGLIRVHPSQGALIQQLRHFPMADHDDGPDALAMLWDAAQTVLRGPEIRLSGRRRPVAGSLAGFVDPRRSTRAVR